MTELREDLLKLTDNVHEAILLNYFLEKGAVQKSLSELNDEVFFGVLDLSCIYAFLVRLTLKNFLKSEFAAYEKPRFEPNLEKITEGLQRLEVENA